MKQHYQKMFAYNKWANQLFIDCFAGQTVANAKSFLLMSHILSAEEIWLHRLQGKEGPQDQLWKELPPAKLQEKTKTNAASWENYLEEIDEQKLQDAIHYKNSKGDSFSTSVADILTHLINLTMALTTGLKLQASLSWKELTRR